MMMEHCRQDHLKMNNYKMVELPMKELQPEALSELLMGNENRHGIRCAGWDRRQHQDPRFISKYRACSF
jgi:hypothetical protein